VSRIRFLLDENVDPILRQALHQQIPEMTVWRVGDPVAPANGTVLVWDASDAEEYANLIWYLPILS